MYTVPPPLPPDPVTVTGGAVIVNSCVSVTNTLETDVIDFVDIVETSTDDTIVVAEPEIVVTAVETLVTVAVAVVMLIIVLTLTVVITSVETEYTVEAGPVPGPVP
jgi:hypothetical protein